MPCLAGSTPVWSEGQMPPAKNPSGAGVPPIKPRRISDWEVGSQHPAAPRWMTDLSPAAISRNSNLAGVALFRNPAIR